jgi:sarcosine oxidase subunit alpha
MPHRLSSPERPIELEFDGEPVIAEDGEPLAFALLASGKVALSRSPKLHRPHGPYCLRGGCDGCVVRVNGEPNVMSCLVACKGGERVETQNVLGSRKVDLMEVTDWFFPRGIDHHHFLAGVPAASFVVQKIARHVAGLGKLPDRARPIGTSRREEVDVLVVGAGPSGLAVALALRAARRLKVVIADDGVTPGGSLRARGAPVPNLSSLDLYAHTTAAGVYEREVLLAREAEAIVVRPRALVLATGTHEGVLAFPGNDLPGVFSARAAALLAHHGIAVGKKVALLGSGSYTDAFLRAIGKRVSTFAVPPGASITAEGRGRLTSITIEAGARKRTSRHAVDALLVEAPGAPSFELAEQAGATVTFDGARGGYLPITDAKGRSSADPFLWCTGELAGTGPSLAAIEAQARAVASDVADALARA